MIGIKQKDYNNVSEEIVFEYLMNRYHKGNGKKTSLDSSEGGTR